MRSRMVILAASVAIAVGGVLLVPPATAKLRSTGAGSDVANWVSHSTPAAPSPSPSPSPKPSPVPATLKAQPVSVTVDGFFSWALMDRKTGTIAGSKKTISATNSTESMVKAWIVSDYLRQVAQMGKTPTATRLEQATLAIRDSDDKAAQGLYAAAGGNAVIYRLIKTCGLTDTKVYSGWWSRTQISARDAVRMGNCIADGRAAGPEWTRWVLATMAKVRGTTAAADQHATTGGGRWGIIDGLPKEIIQQGVSIKNGWTPIGADGNWHVNCLAIGQGWVLAVLMRYPISKGLNYGAAVCAKVAKQLVVPGTATS
jgi:Beta-lactamase enzyme family